MYIVNTDLQKQLGKVDRTNASQQYGLGMQRFAIEGGKWVDGITTDGEGAKEIPSPSFKKPEDVKNGLKK